VQLIVALNDLEISRLKALHQRSIQNGLEGVTWISKDQIPHYEPKCQGLAALHCATTGIVDFREVALSYARDIQNMGGTILTGFQVIDMKQDSSGINQILSSDQVSDKS
jgi:L-2-hydroxyglutarate oxidase LhgO